MNEKPQVVRSPEPRVGAAREAEELRCVAEIVLGRALEGRDRLARVGTAERTKSSPTQAGQTAGMFSLMSGGVLRPMGRAIDIAQEAYRGVVAQMQRLTGREDADTEADEREAVEEKALAEDAERKAAVAAAAEGDLAQERARNQELEQQLSIRQNEQKLMAQERVRTQALEQQLAARADEQKLLAHERVRTQALEQELAARADEQKLLVQERARNQALEQQLAARADEQKLLAQERVRTQALEQQLAARADEQKLLAQERVRNPELEQQLSIRQNDQKLLAPEAPGGREATRLMEQARLLLGQGNITAARSVLERAAESGSTLALFLLAETYDPAILSAWGIFSVWGIFGRRGNVTKARKLYAKAIVGGVHEAKYRLSALRTRVIERRHRLDDAVDWAIESGWLRRRFESAD